MLHIQPLVSVVLRLGIQGVQEHFAVRNVGISRRYLQGAVIEEVYWSARVQELPWMFVRVYTTQAR